MPVENTTAATSRGSETEYWQSIDQWMDSTQFKALMQNEFPEDAAEWLDPVGRRQFLTLMGASVALAGAVGCNPSLKPMSRQKVIPYVRQPDQMLPGVPLFFATTYPGVGGVSQGLVVKQTEGRPIKVEGNPNHPSSLGGTDLISQGTVLGLYDPDRSKDIKKQGTQYGYDKFLEAIKDALAKQQPKQGEGVRFLTDPVTSPTLATQIDEFLKRYPKAKWVQYEPAGRDAAKKAALAAFGKPVNTVYKLDKALVALSLDCDFLSASGPGNVRNARDFMANRKVREVAESIQRGEGIPLEQMNRLYAVESMLTCTGGVADHRLPVPPSQVEAFTRALAAKLGVAGVTAPQLPETAAKWVEPVAADLLAHKGRAVVLPGDTQPPAVHLLAHAINEKLGAVGTTLVYTDPLEAHPADNLAEFAALTREIAAGKVELLFILNVNPAYDSPADLDFAKVLADMPGTKVHLGLYEDETATTGQATWHVNAAHYLETWGDARAHDGTVAIQQPLIAPLSGGKSPLDLFALLLESGTNDPMDVVSATWRKHFDEKVKATDVGKATDFDGWWSKVLQTGVVPGTAFAPVTVSAVKLDALASDKAFAAAKPAGGLEVQFRPDLTLWDGRYANIGWLQELPKPLTKLTWDNAAVMSPATATKLGVTNGFDMSGGEHGHTLADVVSVTVGGRKLNKIAAFILPGHADDAVTLHLGFGRTRAGKVGNNRGFNTYPLRTTAAYWSAPAEVAKVPGESYPLACTQGQYLMEGRRPARSATAAEFAADREFAQVPAASAAEYKEIRANTPGTVEDYARLGRKHPYALPAAHGEAGHVHTEGDDHDAGHAEHDHDKRIIPLSLYSPNPFPVYGGVGDPNGPYAADTSNNYRRWGMVIDLGACTGCTACSIACVSEVNTPVVGKDQVMRGRAMHWLRIDRYFSIPGDGVNSDELGGRIGEKATGPAERARKVQLSDRIRAHFQPVLCQQCEKAPCEVVCPVGATVHSADGLNDMVYNRCVGTRYCSNNCPYKVRRFNFIQYADYNTESLKLVNNPEVTVRTRGVMEKCTYCTQRIRNAEMEAEREWKQRRESGKYDAARGRPRIMDGEVITACQAACPTGAITFGDINDDTSAVLRAKAEVHNYGLLAELNTSPRTSYLAAIRNPNPAMPKGVS